MRNRLVLIVIALLVSGTIISAQDVPMNVQVKLILKILSMDRNFSRFGDPIKIGTSSDEFQEELTAIKGKLKVKGKDFIVEKIASVKDVANYKVIYVGKNWADNYKAVSETASENKCLVFCQEAAGVREGGGAVSFIVVDDRPKIVVNVVNAKSQGTDFPAGFLKITVVVGGL
ncbi:MAG: YfiR family protein [Candidatus Aminicenantes bacterium]